MNDNNNKKTQRKQNATKLNTKLRKMKGTSQNPPPQKKTPTNMRRAQTTRIRVFLRLTRIIYDYTYTLSLYNSSTQQQKNKKQQKNNNSRRVPFCGSAKKKRKITSVKYHISVLSPKAQPQPDSFFDQTTPTGLIRPRHLFPLLRLSLTPLVPQKASSPHRNTARHVHHLRTAPVARFCILLLFALVPTSLPSPLLVLPLHPSTRDRKGRGKGERAGARTDRKRE